jgi:hypothetical protein
MLLVDRQRIVPDDIRHQLLLLRRRGVQIQWRAREFGQDHDRHMRGGHTLRIVDARECNVRGHDG